MPAAKVRFAPRDASMFVTEVKKRVNAHFTSSGISTKADARMIVKSVVLLLLTFGSYGLIMSGLFGPWQMLALCFAMGIGMAGIGFCVSHDALHGSYSSNPRINKLIGYSFDLLGANGYMWKITHNVIHHTYTNIPGLDEDLTVSPLIRLSPEAPRKWFHRYQHFFAFFAYSLSTLNWLFVKDFQCFMMRDIGPYKDKVHPRSEIVTLIVTKLFVVAYMIVLPLVVLDITWWQFLIGFGTAHLTAGVILGVIFQLAHVVEGPEYPMPDDKGMMDNTWIIHEMITTADFAPRNRLLSWYIGGLNYQIEHHLFPQVCSVHYPAIRSTVKETAEQYGVPYNCHPTLMAAMKSHYRMLKQLGQSELQAVPSASVAQVT